MTKTNTAAAIQRSSEALPTENNLDQAKHCRVQFHLVLPVLGKQLQAKLQSRDKSMKPKTIGNPGVGIGLLRCPRRRQITPKSLVKLVLAPNLERGEETVRDDLRHVMLPLYLTHLGYTSSSLIPT